MTQRTILEEIRHVRHLISEEIGHDPRRIANDDASLQADLKDRIINSSGESTTNRTIRCEEEEKRSVSARSETETALR